MKYDQEFFLNIYLKERLAFFNEATLNSKQTSIPRGAKVFWEKSIEKVYLEDNRVALKMKRETFETDYLIFCYNSAFFDDVVVGMKDYDPKKPKNFENVSKDFIRMSHKITDNLTAFRDLEIISFPELFFTFRKKFWNSIKEDITLINENDQPFLMLYDLSKNPKESPHILIVCKQNSLPADYQIDDAQKKKVYKVIGKVLGLF